MSNIIKVSLTIELEGSTLISQGTEWFETTIKTFDEKKRKTVEKKVGFEQKKLITKPAYQVLKISEESYNYMTSLASSSIKPKEWARLSKKQRLEYHLSKIALSLGGKSYTYVIMED